MINLRLQDYAAISIEYSEINRGDTDIRNAFFAKFMEPYWQQFEDCETSLRTVLFSHVNDMVHITGDDHKRMRAEFIKWLLFRYPNTQNVGILAKAEFAEFLNENPRFKN